MKTIIGWILQCTFGALVAIVILYAFGSMIEGAGQYYEEHDRCLNKATNGLEIQQCR